MYIVLFLFTCFSFSLGVACSLASGWQTVPVGAGVLGHQYKCSPFWARAWDYCRQSRPDDNAPGKCRPTAVVVMEGGREDALSTSCACWKSVCAEAALEEILPWFCYCGSKREGGNIDAVEWENHLEKDQPFLHVLLKLPWNHNPRKSIIKILRF